MSDYTELQKAAEYAAQDVIKFADENEEIRALQQFHEEVDPETVLALIADNARLANDHADLALRNKVLRERPDLAADRISCHDQVIQLQAQRDQLKAENEALRKDADKWQIVERAMTQLQSDEQGAAIWSACSRILISVAGKLNSAHSTVTEEGVTFDGIEAGDWRVTVERIDAAMDKGEQS